MFCTLLGCSIYLVYLENSAVGGLGGFYIVSGFRGVSPCPMYMLHPAGICCVHATIIIKIHTKCF